MYFFESANCSCHHRGSIEGICGSMFSGKTEELLRRLKRAKFAKQRVEIFKPCIDTRYSETEVVSHDHNAIQSTPVESSQNILLMAGDVDVIGIDEAQFFDNGIVDVCRQLSENGYRVIVAGESQVLLGETDKYEPICRHCYNEEMKKRATDERE